MTSDGGGEYLPGAGHALEFVGPAAFQPDRGRLPPGRGRCGRRGSGPRRRAWRPGPRCARRCPGPHPLAHVPSPRCAPRHGPAGRGRGRRRAQALRAADRPRRAVEQSQRAIAGGVHEPSLVAVHMAPHQLDGSRRAGPLNRLSPISAASLGRTRPRQQTARCRGTGRGSAPAARRSRTPRWCPAPDQRPHRPTHRGPGRHRPQRGPAGRRPGWRRRRTGRRAPACAGTARPPGPPVECSSQPPGSVVAGGWSAGQAESSGALPGIPGPPPWPVSPGRAGPGGWDRMRSPGSTAALIRRSRCS